MQKINEPHTAWGVKCDVLSGKVEQSSRQVILTCRFSYIGRSGRWPEVLAVGVQPDACLSRPAAQPGSALFFALSASEKNFEIFSKNPFTNESTCGIILSVKRIITIKEAG